MVVTAYLSHVNQCLQVLVLAWRRSLWDFAAQSLVTGLLRLLVLYFERSLQ